MSIHITEYGIIFYHVEGIAGETKLFHFLMYMGVRARWGNKCFRACFQNNRDIKCECFAGGEYENLR